MNEQSRKQWNILKSIIERHNKDKVTVEIETVDGKRQCRILEDGKVLAKFESPVGQDENVTITWPKLALV